MSRATITVVMMIVVVVVVVVKLVVLIVSVSFAVHDDSSDRPPAVPAVRSLWKRHYGCRRRRRRRWRLV